MHINSKILFSCFILVLFLVPNLVFGCVINNNADKVEKSMVPLEFRQSFAEIQPECSSGDCEDECCHPKSHQCSTGDCSGSCSGNTCNSFQFPVFVDGSKLINSQNKFDFTSKRSQFYYLNPFYSNGFHTIWQPPKIG